MKFFILLSLVLHNLLNYANASSPTEPKKLKVEVYYETLCPDSMNFVRNQLYKAMKSNNWLPYTDLKFIPYGKVNVWTDPITNITNLDCQHGSQECELNALHACIVEHNTIEDQLEMFNCLLNGYYTDVDECANRLAIDLTAARNCRSARNINDILKIYGDKTKSIQISFVPSIAMNGMFNLRKQRAILYNFSREFCRQYKETFDITLEKC